MVNVLMYTKKVCPFCVRAKGLLKAKGITVEEILIEGSPELKYEMMDKSKGAMTVPQIFIGDFHVGGCDELFAIEARGELDSILA